jgi:hypothetical protein
MPVDDTPQVPSPAPDIPAEPEASGSQGTQLSPGPETAKSLTFRAGQVVVGEHPFITAVQQLEGGFRSQAGGVLLGALTQVTIRELQDAKQELRQLRLEIDETRRSLAESRTETAVLHVELKSARNVRRLQNIFNTAGALIAGWSAAYVGDNIGVGVGGMVLGIGLLVVGWWRSSTGEAR